MKKISSTLFILCIICQAATAQANDFYLGYDYFFADYHESGITASVSGLGFKAGWQPADFLAIEARAGCGMGYDTLYVGASKVTFGIDQLLGIYLKGQVPLEGIRPYLLAGYSQAELSASSGWYTESIRESDLSVGMGMDLLVGDSLSFGLEYLRLIGNDTFNLSTTAFSMSFYF